MTPSLLLVSHALCPYVQRVAITLREKGLVFERRDIDLAHKPAWFLALSPTGKTPLLQVDDTPIFESSVICEYLDDVHAPHLHPMDPLQRARHRAWMELASALLADIAALYSAADDATLQAQAQRIHARLDRVEDALGEGPWFDGEEFSLVDAAFAPALRYFDVIDEAGLGFFERLPKLRAWRCALAGRRSVQRAVSADYPQQLRRFLHQRGGALATHLSEHPDYAHAVA